MSVNLRIGIVVVALFILFTVLSTLKKGRIPVKYSLVWIFSSLLLLLIAILPDLFTWLSTLLGFETMSNMVIGIFIFILLMITIVLTIIVSGQRKKITLLIQEVSMLKSERDK